MKNNHERKRKSAIASVSAAVEVVDVEGAELYNHVRSYIAKARAKVYVAANKAMVEAYWNVGREIVERQGGAERAKYGDGLIRHLALKLTAEFGPGYDVANLCNMRQFYLVFEKRYTLCSELTWSLPAVEELQLELQCERAAIEEAQLLAMVDEPRKAKRLANLTKER